MPETWKPVVGLENRYEVSSLGRVRNSQSGHELRPRKRNKYGHIGFALYNGCGQVLYRTAHSLVAEAFLGPRPSGQEVRHLNGVPTDNRVSNLAYGTRSENHRDCYVYGGKHGRGKLSKDQVLEIKALLASGVRQTDIAKQFGVNDGTIHHIRTGKNFSYII